jgi:hypothetical protein
MTPTVTITNTPTITPITNTPTITPTITQTPSYTYSTTNPSIFSTISSTPGEISLINPVPNAYQSTTQTIDFITTPSFSAPAFMFSSNTLVPQQNIINTEPPFSLVPSYNINSPAPDYTTTFSPNSYSDSNTILPAEVANTQYYTPSSTPANYFNINLPESSNLLSPYSYATNPLAQEGQNAEYYANTPIDQSTLFGAIQSKYGFYK